MPRQKRVPAGTPGTKINPATATKEQVRRSLQFMRDYNEAMDACEEIRRDCEAKGVDPFDYLARVVAHNHAVHKDIGRLRNKGVETRKWRAAETRNEIVRQLAHAAGSVKAVAIDRQSADKPSSSETTIRRAKKTAPGGSQ